MPGLAEYCPLEVVFVGDWRTEEGQDRVSHEPGNGAFIPVDRRVQVLKGAVHDLSPFFRVQTLSGGRRPGDAGWAGVPESRSAAVR